MPWYVVVRRFGGTNGAALLIGQLISLPDGTRTNQLVEQRFVRPATPTEVESAEEVEVDAPPPSETPKVRRRKPGKKALVS